MRTTLKRAGILLLLLVFVASAFGAKPKLVSEAEAKKAGLALINQAFNVSETEASVEYQARVATTFHDGTTNEEVKLEPDRIYVVKAAPGKGETEYYYAEVDAVTGNAYLAERFLSGIVLTDEQKKQAEAFGTMEEIDPEDLRSVQQDASKTIDNLVVKRLEPEIPILRVFPDNIETDSVDYPKVLLYYFVLMQNGKSYDLALCWPTMELVSVYIRN